jgi:hypothetical protein
VTRWTTQDLHKTSWFGPLLEQIQRELNTLCAEQHDARPALQREHEQLRQQMQGWSLSLAKSDLNPAVRSLIEKDLEAALQRQQAIEGQMAEIDAMRRRTEAVVDPEQVVDRLNRLAEILAGQNPSRTNMELSLHIDTIQSYRDGRIVVRTCMLGALAGTAELFSRPPDVSPQGTAGASDAMVAKPRRRALRRVVADDGNQSALQAAAHEAADVDRFADLGPEWFWVDEFRLPEKTCWTQKYAEEVAALRATGWTIARLVAHFGKTIPTIRAALRLAKKANPSLELLPRKMPRRRWADDHFAEVLELKEKGLSVPAIARHFSKSEPTIRKAIQSAMMAAQPTRSAPPHSESSPKDLTNETDSANPVAP